MKITSQQQQVIDLAIQNTSQQQVVLTAINCYNKYYDNVDLREYFINILDYLGYEKNNCGFSKKSFVD